MSGWTLKAAKVVAMAGLLIAGVGVSAALADNGNGNGNDPQATTTPGSPGDDCSHGSNTVPCRPDPNQNGKDCEDHGNAKGNEDHCNQTTTTESTPETTTTVETITTNPGTTTNPGSSGTTPGNGGSSSTPAGGSAPSSASAPPVSTPAQQVKAAQASRVEAASSTPGELPFTGFPAWVLALIGSAMLAAGLGMRRVASGVAS
jgi:hypothetical protein